MEIKGMRLVNDEPKSKAEIEEQLLEEHAKETQEEIKEEPKAETPEVINEEPVKLALNDEDVLSYIKEKKNLEINSLDEFDALMQKRNEPQIDIDEEALAYNKYKRETGRSIEEFIKLQKDWTKEDPESTLREFYRQQDPDLTQRELEYKLRQFKYDEDIDDEDEIAEKRLKMREELKKAVGHFESQKEQYKMPVASADTFVPESERENYKSYKQYKESIGEVEQENRKRSQYFAEQTDKLFSSEFEGFKFKLGDKDVSWKPAEANALKDAQSDVSKFIGQFLDDKGYLKDAEAFHKAIAVAMNAERLASFAYEQGKADGIGQLEKESKNIDMVRETPKVAKDGGIKMRIVNDGQPDFKIRK